MFYCTGKLPLLDKAALRSTTRKDEKFNNVSLMSNFGLSDD